MTAGPADPPKRGPALEEALAWFRRYLDEASPKALQVVDGVVTLFAARGFGGASVPDLTEAAGVGPATVYRHFGHKAGLVNGVYRVCKARMILRAFENVDVAAVPFKHAFLEVCGNLVDWVLEHPAAFGFLENHHHEAYLDDASRRFDERVGALMTAAFAPPIAHGVVKAMPVPLLMAVLMGSVSRAALLVERGRLTLDVEQRAMLLTALWEAIRA